MTEVASVFIDEPVALHIAFQVVLVTMLRFNQLLRQRGLLSTPDNERELARICGVEIYSLFLMFSIRSRSSGVRRLLEPALVRVMPAVRAIKLDRTGKQFHITSFAIRRPRMNIKVHAPICDMNVLDSLIHFAICHSIETTTARKRSLNTPFGNL